MSDTVRLDLAWAIAATAKRMARRRQMLLAMTTTQINQMKLACNLGHPVALQVTDAFGASDISKTDIFIDYTPIVVTSILDVTDPSKDATELTLREAIELATRRPVQMQSACPLAYFH